MSTAGLLPLTTFPLLDLSTLLRYLYFTGGFLQIHTFYSTAFIENTVLVTLQITCCLRAESALFKIQLFDEQSD